MILDGMMRVNAWDTRRSQFNANRFVNTRSILNLHPQEGIANGMPSKAHICNMDYGSSSFEYILRDDVTGKEKLLTVVKFNPVKIPVCVKDSLVLRLEKMLILQYLSN